jgi:type IV pilus assembly protein PilA
MLTSIKQRRDREDEGFTLIELMVVVLIIAILLAIAIPTFLGARNTANARAAQSNLRNATTAEQTEWTNTQAFSSSQPTMSGIESALGWVDNSAGTVTIKSTDTTPNEVLAETSDTGQIVVLTALGKDNKCWSMAQVNDPSDTAFEGTSYAEVAATNTGGVYSCGNPAAPSAATTAGSAATNSPNWSTTF